MKKVAKIAAPFASLIPGVGPLVSLGLGAIGSIGGGSSGGGGGSSSSNNAMNSQLTGLIQQQNQRGQQMFDQGKPITEQGVGALTKSAGYYGDLMGGGKASDAALAAPISDLKNASNNLLQNVGKFSPRGNIAGNLMDRQSQVGQQIARMRFEGQGQGAAGLAGIGSSLLQGGTNLQAGGAQTSQGSLSTLLGMRGQDMQQTLAKMQIDAQNNQGLGQGIGNILGMLLSPGGMLNKPKNPGKSGAWGSFKLPDMNTGGIKF